MRTVYAKNLNQILLRYRGEIEDGPNIDLARLKSDWRYWRPNQQEISLTESAMEMMEIVNGKLSIDGFNHKEAMMMFDAICTI